VVEFDDVVIKKIIDGDPSTLPKPDERRLSSETKVTLKEMEDNYHRSDEITRKQKKGQPQPTDPQDDQH
jgi:hypothetical protein